MTTIQLQEPEKFDDVSLPFSLLSWTVNGKICFTIDHRFLPGGANIEENTLATPTIEDGTIFLTEDGRYLKYLNGSIKDDDPQNIYTGVPTINGQIG